MSNFMTRTSPTLFGNSRPRIRHRNDMAWQQNYLDRYYARSSGWVDGTTQFHELCASVIPSGGEILEIGSGPSNETSTFLSSLGTLEGIDIDPDVLGNNALSAAHVLSGEVYPFSDNTFDACVSNYVNEHISDPRRHLEEVCRVLKPNGVYVFRTPNRFHYTAVVSHLTPHWFHKLVANRLRNLPATSHDPYPTRYRFNSRAAVERYADELGFTIDKLRLIEPEPLYGMSSRILFFSFLAYERTVNAHELLAGLRANILSVMRKKA